MTATTRVRPIRYRRGKAIPALRHGDVLDLSTWPLGTSPRGRGKIALCPDCGRKGERTTYRGTAPDAYVHSTRFETAWWMTLECCHVAKETE